MAFAQVPALAFTPGVSTLPGSVANVWRDYFPSALDADGGGDYANTVLIKFTSGSAGWEFDCPVTIGAGGTLSIDGGSGEVASGSTLTVQSGGFLTVDSGGTVTFLSGADLAVNAGASLFMAGTESVTGTVTYQASSSWALQGEGIITAGGFILANFTGRIDIGQDGVLRHLSGGTISHASGSTETHASGSTDTYSSGSIVADGSTRTRTGPETRSGSGAYTADRPLAVGPNADTTIDAKSTAVTRVPTLTAARDWTLNDPGFSDYIEHTIVRKTVGANAFALGIFDADGITELVRFTSGSDEINVATFGWDGSNWFAKTWNHVGNGAGTFDPILL